jgi:hypothetical protein
VSETAVINEVSVEERVLIRDLYDRMYWALNTGDAEGIRACWAPGGHVVRGGVGDVIDFEKSVEIAVNGQNDPVGKTTQHHVTNFIVDPDPDGREDCRAVRLYFIVTLVESPPETRVRWSCRSNDTVQRIDGRWLIFKREISLNHPDTK